MSVKREDRLDGPRYIVWWKDESRRTRNKTFRLKADADAYDAKIKLAKRTGEFASFDMGKQPLREFCDEWLQLYGEPRLARKTLGEYRRYLKNDILPELGHIPLRELTPHRVQQFTASLTTAGRGDACVRKILGVLQGIMERAVEWGRISVNPVKSVKKPSAKKASVTTAASPRGIETLRSRLAEIRDRTLVSVMAYGNLRPGEALALRWVDIRERSILVTKSVSLGEEKGTKTGNHRSVPLMKPLLQDLNEWRMASGRPDDDALIFPATNGGLWKDHDYRNWRKRIFKPAAADLGVWRPYDLRHAYASLRFAERANPAEIAKEMGHSLEVLLGTYVHVIVELKEARLASAEDLILEARRAQFLTTSRERVPAVEASDQ